MIEYPPVIVLGLHQKQVDEAQGKHCFVLHSSAQRSQSSLSRLPNMMIPFKMSSVVRTQGQAPVKTNKEEEWSSSIQHATHLWCYQWKQLVSTVSGWNAPLQKQIEKVTHDFGLRPFNVNPLIPLNNGFPTVLQKI